MYIKQDMLKNNALYRGTYELLKVSLKAASRDSKRIVGKRCVCLYGKFLMGTLRGGYFSGTTDC